MNILSTLTKRLSFNRTSLNSSTTTATTFISDSQMDKEGIRSLDPTKTYNEIKVKQKFQQVKPIPFDTPKQPGHLRFVCISDTHSLTKNLKLPDGDVLLHAGDFSNIGRPSEVQGFANFLLSTNFKHRIVIAGNHDLTFDKQSYPSTYRRFGHPEMYDVDQVKAMLLVPGITYLEDSGVNLDGINIYGSPWQPEFCDWAFNLPRGEPCRQVWKKIPDNVDILITHGPPLGHGDTCTSGERAGCYDLLKEIQQRIKPKYHLFGHIHEGYGMTTDGVTTYINASICNYQYRPIQPPIIFDFPQKLAQ